MIIVKMINNYIIIMGRSIWAKKVDRTRRIVFLPLKACGAARTSDSLNEGLPIKMTREKFQRK